MKRIIIFISLIFGIVMLSYLYAFITINKDLFDFINWDERYPTAREVLNDDGDADIIKVDNLIYLRADDWHALTPNFPLGEEIGKIEKRTTKVLWFSNMYATKLEEGTKIYSGEREYRRGDAPFRILIEEDGEIVFYQTLVVE